MRTKEERKRCKKGHETTIGKIIYGFLLFLPLLAIGVTCGYVMFNKNAYQSYTGSVSFKREYQLNTYINNSEITQETITDNTYTTTKLTNPYWKDANLLLNIKNDLDGRDSILIYTNNFQYNNNNIPEEYNAILFTATWNSGLQRIAKFYNLTSNFVIVNHNNINTVTSAELYNDGTFITPLYTLQLYGNIQTNPVNFTSSSNDIYIKKNSGTGLTSQWFANISVITWYVDSNLNNAFYTSIQKVEESTLFNWSKNSIIYTGMSNFTTALSITNTFVPTLLTYWLIISIVYFMYDIILMILTILHRKIHDLQDSI